MTTSSIASSASLALFLFVLVLKILGLARLYYFPTVNRVTQDLVFGGSLLGETYDTVILVLAGLVAVVCLVISRVSGSRWESPWRSSSWAEIFPRGYWGSVTLALTALLTMLCLLSIGRWVVYLVQPSQVYGDGSWHFAQLDEQLFDVFGLLSPYLIIVIVFWWVFRVPVALLADRAGVNLLSARWLFKNPQDFMRGAFIRRHRMVILSASAALALAFVTLPYLPTVNPGGTGVSVDTHYYTDWIDTMRTLGSGSAAATAAFTTISNGDRPLFLLPVFAVLGVAPGLPSSLVEYVPVVLGPALVFATYVSVSKGTGDDDLAVVSAFLAPFSYPLMVGMYTGSFANWAGFVVMLLFLGFFAAFVTRPNPWSFVASLGVGVLTLLTYEYAWPPLAAGSAIFLLLRWRAAKVRLDRRVLWASLGVLAVVSILDVVRQFVISAPGAFSSEYAIASGATGQGWTVLTGFDLRMASLQYASHYLSSGFVSNAPLLVLAACGALFAGVDSVLVSYVLSLGVVTEVALLYGDDFTQLKGLYELPLFLLAAYTLLFAIRAGRGRQTVLAAAAVLFVLTEMDFALRSMVNLPP